MPEIHGTTDPAFAAVRDAFAANFEEGLEVGASVAVTVDGKPVVDLWAGDRNPAGDPWEEDTIVNVYSTTKTMAALSVLMCADRGLVDFEAPVATYWPEFAANGKEGVLVKHVMSHSSGVAGFDPAIPVEALYDWDATVAHLAAQTPWWDPGTQMGYHAVTQGFLQGEIVRRVTGRSIGTFFRDEVAGPLGADFHIGLDAEHDHRVGDLVPPPDRMADMTPDAAATMSGRVLLSCPMDATETVTREWRGAEIPAAGGTGNARSVARVHAAMACGGSVDDVTLLGPDTLEAALVPQISGHDQVMDADFTYGMGFGLPNDLLPLPNPRTLFWGGWGGSLAIIDLDARLSFAYVMNRMAPELMGDQRGGTLAMAAYMALLS